jgi:MYXO-CTERM domain-containing protein
VQNTPAITSSRIVFADSWDSSTGIYGGALDPMFRSTTLTWVDPMYASSTSGTMHDLALLYVDGPPPPQVKPPPLYRLRLGADALGKSDRFIGFGLRSATSSSSLYERIYAAHSIDEMTPMEIGWNSGSAMTCGGDSGGPHLVSFDGVEQIVAVTSFGDEGCATESFAQRVDVGVPGILQFIADHDPQPTANCGADGVCGWACPEIDPDCPCVADGKCTTACPNPDLDPDCPLHCNADHVCQRTGCPVPDPDCGDLPSGALCLNDDECLSGLCVPYVSAKICTVACDGTSCPGSFVCNTLSNVCVPGADRTGGCRVGGGAGGAWLVALVLLRLRRRRHEVRDRRKLA